MSTVTGQVTDAGQIGVLGESTQFEGVRGLSHAAGHGGVVGINDSQGDNAGQGVFGQSTNGEGVRGISSSPYHGGVVGTNDNAAAGVYGESKNGEGVRGVGHSADHAAVVGTNDNAAGIGVFGKGGRLAARFEGGVEITGDLQIQGVSIQAWLQRIITLEREVATLQHGCARPGGVPTVPTLNSVTNEGQGTFQVKGTGFLHSHVVHLRVTNVETLAGNDSTSSSDGAGNLDFSISIGLQAPGTVLAFAANDERPNPQDGTGTLWSKTFTITV